MCMPRAVIPQDDCHRRQRLQSLLVNEAQLVGVAGIGAEPHAERVEDRVAPGELLPRCRYVPVDLLLVVDAHAGTRVRSRSRGCTEYHGTLTREHAPVSVCQRDLAVLDLPLVAFPAHLA